MGRHDAVPGLQEELRQVRPHNGKHSIDLRKMPRCYLCGGAWTSYPHHEPVARCKKCSLVTFVKFDMQVFEARRWPILGMWTTKRGKR